MKACRWANCQRLRARRDEDERKSASARGSHEREEPPVSLRGHRRASHPRYPEAGTAAARQTWRRAAPSSIVLAVVAALRVLLEDDLPGTTRRKVRWAAQIPGKCASVEGFNGPRVVRRTSSRVCPLRRYRIPRSAHVGHGRYACARSAAPRSGAGSRRHTPTSLMRECALAP